mmetsp:Transcript_69257/g.184706  ORF Transcript_69257/g.184706 Transcript_69257/m.184706 type:complete len:104 (+) Transcript_69257:453-764(+)
MVLSVVMRTSCDKESHTPEAGKVLWDLSHALVTGKVMKTNPCLRLCVCARIRTCVPEIVRSLHTFHGAYYSEGSQMSCVLTRALVHTILLFACCLLAYLIVCI